MKKKKKVAKITEYSQHENVKGLSPWSVQQIFGKDAIHGVARLVTCNRDKIPEQKVEILELHGTVIGPIVQSVGSDTWEVLECELIIIPRRRLESLRTNKDDKPDMNRMTAQQIYMGSDILKRMENSYLIRSDPDTTEYDREYIEVIKK